MTKYIHADLMMQYAQDAQETDKPWELWQMYDPVYKIWVDVKYPIAFKSVCNYRHKLKTININGFEVPEPEKTNLNVGESYYLVDIISDVSKLMWNNYKIDFNALNNGLIHKSRDAAKLHRKALLSFTIQEK